MGLVVAGAEGVEGVVGLEGAGRLVLGAVVVEHLHGDLEVVEAGGVDPPNLLVGHLPAQHEPVELFCRGVLGHLEELACVRKLEACRF